MVYLLSIGYILLILALRLALLRRMMRSRKEEDLRRIGLTVLALGAVAGVVAGVIRLINLLSSQEANALTNVAIAIVLTGGIIAVQGEIQKKPEQLKHLGWYILASVLLGLSLILAFIILRLLI